jgi:16S rRNA processing protein RimM
MPSEPKICYAKIGRAHGLRGELRCFPDHPDSTLLSELRDVELRGAFGRRTVHLRSAKRATSTWVIQIDGVNDRTAAEALTGAELWIDAETLPPADPDEFYGYQLAGLRVLAPSGEPIGEVLRLVDFGAGDLLELRIGRTEIFIPFAEPYVTAVDPEAGTLVAVVEEWMP